MKRHTFTTLFILAVALAVAVLLQNQQPVFAGGASVVSGPCFFDNGGGSLWEGNGSWVQTPSGLVNGSCHATLVSGPGVTETTDVEFIGGTPFGEATYRGILTPSGNAELFTED